MGITREELINSPEWHLAGIQQLLFEEVSQYLEINNITQKEFAEKSGFNESDIAKIIEGDYDPKISEFVELLLAIGKVPLLTLKNKEEKRQLQERTDRKT